MRGLILGLAAIAGLAAMPASAQQVLYPAVVPDGTVLEVSAQGKTTRVPDMAVIQAGVTIQAPTAGAAYAQSNTKMASVVAALREAGVAERDIQTSNISLQPQYRDRDNEAPVIFAYQASTGVTVRFRDVKKSGAVLDVLVRQGVNTISGPDLTISQPEAALDEARVDAVGKARARADLYARAAGLRVDRILSISDSDSPVVVTGFRAGNAGFMMDKAEIAPGEQEVTANVTVRFLLK